MTNLVPLVVLPLTFAAISLAVQSLLRFLRSEKVFTAIQIHPFWPFALFVIASFVYALSIGVDVTNPLLYRHEFKYFVSFGWLIIYGLLEYPPAEHSAKAISWTLVGMGLFAVAWYAIGRFDPNLLSSRYPSSAAGHGMWEYYISRTIYLGAFLNHDSAGAFEGSMTILLGSLVGRHRRLLPLLLAWSCAILLDLTASRSFIVGVFCTSIWFFVSELLLRRRTSSEPRLVVSFLGILLISSVGTLPAISAVYVGIARHTGGALTTWLRPSHYPGLESLTSAAADDLSMWLSPSASASMTGIRVARSLENINSVEAKTSKSRLFLARIALEDFIRSPLIGVGAARFDNDPRVLSTILLPENIGSRTTSNPTFLNSYLGNPDQLGFINKGRIKFLNLPLLHINIGTFITHIDERAHDAYLSVLAEGGVIFFIVFIFMYARFYRALGSTERSNSSETLGSLAAGSRRLFICVAIASLTTDSFIDFMAVIYLFSAGAFILSLSQSGPSLPYKDVHKHHV